MDEIYKRGDRVVSLKFNLSLRLIAQGNNALRKNKLLILSRKTGKIIHSTFDRLGSYLNKNDLLVLNNTKVMPTRLWGLLDSGGQVEVTLVNRIKGPLWRAMIRPDIGLKKGKRIYFGNNLSGALNSKTKGLWFFEFNGGSKRIEKIIAKIGKVNLPFYLKYDVGLNKYQNVYARIPGSTQCPTAGLHFRQESFVRLKSKGIDTAFITLHIGSSVLPVTVNNLDKIKVDAEYFKIPDDTVNKINACRKLGGRVIAVGTTVARTLESATGANGKIRVKKGWTGLTITSGYKFKIMDGFLTNFHLPNSSHLLMTSAFGGRDNVMRSYKEAVKKRYQFLDFGDAMLII